MNTNQQNESQSFQDYKTRIGHYSTLQEALAAAMLKGNFVWRIYDETREPYDLVEIYRFAQKYDQANPITGNQFYWTSREGAIGISMGLEYRVKWLFIPMEPGLERDELVVKMGERMAEVDKVKDALNFDADASTAAPPPALSPELTMPELPQQQPVQGMPVQGMPMPQPEPQPIQQPVQVMPVQGMPIPDAPMPEPQPMQPEPQPIQQPIQPEPQPVQPAPQPIQPAPQPIQQPMQGMPVQGMPVQGMPVPDAPMPEPQPAFQPEPQPIQQPIQPEPQPIQQPIQPEPQPVQQPIQPEPQPVQQPIQAQPAPQQPMQQPVQQPMQPQQPQPVQPAPQSGGKSKLPMIIGGVVAALLIAGGGYFAYNHFIGSKDATTEQEVTAAATENENPTAEPTTQTTNDASDAGDAKALTTAAISELKSATTAQQGIDKLNQAIGKGGKESVEALYTLAQLYGRVYSDKDVLANVEKLLPKDPKKAHELNEKAVAIDNTYYPALYELGCDYMAGEARGAVDRDIDKAKQYFTEGAKYAQQANDTQLAERFEIRLSSLE